MYFMGLIDTLQFGFLVHQKRTTRRCDQNRTCDYAIKMQARYH